MFKHIVSYPNGTVVYFHSNKIIISPKGEAPFEWVTSNNSKGNYGFYHRPSNLWSDSIFCRNNKLFDDIQTGNKVVRGNH